MSANNNKSPKKLVDVINPFSSPLVTTKIIPIKTNTMHTIVGMLDHFIIFCFFMKILHILQNLCKLHNTGSQ